MLNACASHRALRKLRERDRPLALALKRLVARRQLGIHPAQLVRPRYKLFLLVLFVGRQCGDHGADGARCPVGVLPPVAALLAAEHLVKDAEVVRDVEVVPGGL